MIWVAAVLARGKLRAEVTRLGRTEFGERLEGLLPCAYQPRTPIIC